MKMAMTAADAIAELLARLGAERGESVLVCDDDLGQWPADAVAAMKSQKLLRRARPASPTDSTIQRLESPERWP